MKRSSSPGRNRLALRAASASTSLLHRKAAHDNRPGLAQAAGVKLAAPTCPFDACDGSGFLVDERSNSARDCKCRVQLIATRRRRALGATIPRKYAGVSLERPPVTLISPAVTFRVTDYIAHLDARLQAGAGLWLTGSVGTGKTTLAMLVSKHAIEAGRSVAIYSLPSLLSRIRATFDDEHGLSHVDFIDRLKAVDLLHIDDVGAEKTSAWVLEQLYEIVNARYEAQRAIVITTNLAHDELVEQIGERTVSRLEETCEIVFVNGPDARLQRHDLRVA